MQQRARILMLLGILLISWKTNAQCSWQYNPTQFKHQLSITPFAMIDYDPSLRLSYERKFNFYDAILIQGGWVYTLMNRQQLRSTNARNSGFQAAIEYRHYFKGNNNENFFIGARGHVMKAELSKLLWFDSLGIVGNDFEHPTRQEKFILSAILIGGLSFSAHKNLMLEMVLGIGAGHRIVKNHVPEHWGEPIFIKEFREEIIESSYNGWFTPYPYFQVKVGWAWNQMHRKRGHLQWR